MAGWHHCLDGRESEWTPGVGDGQGGLACCDSWGCKESDTTEQLNWTELNQSKRQSSPHSSLDSFIRGMVFSVYKRLVRKILQKGDGQGGGGCSHHTISLFSPDLLPLHFLTETVKNVIDNLLLLSERGPDSLLRRMRQNWYTNKRQIVHWNSSSVAFSFHYND